MIHSQEGRVLAQESSKSRYQNSLKRQIIKKAKEDLSRRLSIKIDRIKLLEVREIIWLDSSLGCPQPGKVYNQVPQEGMLVRLNVEKRIYFYHSGKNTDPFFCEQTTQAVPRPSEVDEFVPPPGVRNRLVRANRLLNLQAQ